MEWTRAARARDIHAQIRQVLPFHRQKPPPGTAIPLFNALLARLIRPSVRSVQSGVVMAGLGNVFASLQTMSLLQLLLGLVACTGYALAQGSLVGGRTRVIACGMALSAAFGFAIEATEWTHGVMLMAFAVTGLGLFVVAVCWLSALMGFNGYHATAVDSSFLAPESDFDIPAIPARPRVETRTRPAHSI